MNDTEKIIEYLKTVPIGVQLVYCLIAIALGVLAIVAMWKVFVKAGEKGWKSLVPFYNLYILFKICWNSKYFWIYLAATVASSALNGASEAFAQGSAGNIVFLVLAIAVSIYLIYLDVVLALNLAKAFGHGVGFGIGLAFLEFIFMLILAFDSSKYVGNPTEVQQVDNNDQNNIE